jgi:deazaflavin-dependent oxidoreductase (nitroreductase family)
MVMSVLQKLPRFTFRWLKLPPRILYRLGLGPIIGQYVFLLTTTGRRSGLPRVTPLQYETRDDGTIMAAAMHGTGADWVRNILADPCVEVQVKNRRFRGQAEIITDRERIADFVADRLRRHPRMIGGMLRAEGLPARPSRKQLADYAAGLALVVIHPEQEKHLSPPSWPDS